jgi:hypothetical protein
MIYDYIVSPHPRRLVFTAAGLPTVTIPLHPVVFGALLDMVEQEGEASLPRLQDALYYVITTVPSVVIIEATETEPGGADAS